MNNNMQPMSEKKHMQVFLSTSLSNSKPNISPTLKPQQYPPIPAPNHSITPALKQSASLKILASKLTQIVQYSPNSSLSPPKLSQAQQSTLLSIITHARTNQNLRELINLRYTNKLNYLLEKFDMSGDLRARLREEIQRVGELVLGVAGDISAIAMLQRSIM